MAALLTGVAETGITTGQFVRRRKVDGYFWSTDAVDFEAYNPANIADYGIAATETGSTGVYTTTDPAETTEGDFLFTKAAGASLAVSDLATGVRWEGEAGGLSLDAIAGAVFKLDLSTLTGEASRSLLNAVRKLRNKWSVSGTTLTVFKEDGTTPAYTQTLTAVPEAAPITGVS